MDTGLVKLLILTCLGVTTDSHTSRVFHLEYMYTYFSQARTWAGSNIVCEEKNMSLLHFGTMNDYRLFNTYRYFHNVQTEIWIRRYWNVSPSYQHGSAFNQQGQCWTVNTRTGDQNERPCSSEIPFVCEAVVEDCKTLMDVLLDEMENYHESCKLSCLHLYYCLVNEFTCSTPEFQKDVILVRVCGKDTRVQINIKGFFQEDYQDGHNYSPTTFYDESFINGAVATATTDIPENEISSSSGNPSTISTKRILPPGTGQVLNPANAAPISPTLISSGYSLSSGSVESSDATSRGDYASDTYRRPSHQAGNLYPPVAHATSYSLSETSTPSIHSTARLQELKTIKHTTSDSTGNSSLTSKYPFKSSSSENSFIEVTSTVNLSLNLSTSPTSTTYHFILTSENQITTTESSSSEKTPMLPASTQLSINPTSSPDISEFNMFDNPTILSSKTHVDDKTSPGSTTMPTEDSTEELPKNSEYQVESSTSLGEFTLVSEITTVDSRATITATTTNQATSSVMSSTNISSRDEMSYNITAQPWPGSSHSVKMFTPIFGDSLCNCPCRQKKEQVKVTMLQIFPNRTSSYLRRKTSASDNRRPSQMIGTAAISIIIMVFTSIALADIFKIVSYLSLCWRKESHDHRVKLG